jgi:general nucleoside transport system permease protein
LAERCSEKEMKTKAFRELYLILLAIFGAFLVGGIFILIIGDDPINTYRILLANSFGSAKDFGYTLFYATPLIFTGLSVAVAFRCGLFNIGAEGQLYIAAFATAWMGIKFGGVVVKVSETEQNWSWANLPVFLLVPLCILTAIVVGGIWGAIPGILRARFGASEVINTIMLNFIAIALTSYLTQYHYRIPGDPILQTAPIGTNAYIPQLNEFFSFIPKDVPLNVSFLIAVLMCFAVYIFLWRTKWGYELRAAGENPYAAEYGGISTKKQIIIAMTLAGALAGMVAIGEVLGDRHRYFHDFSGEVGFLGIAVALLGRNHPLGVFLAALFFAVLIRGEIFVDAFTKHVSKDIGLILQAILILFVACMEKYSRK